MSLVCPHCDNQECLQTLPMSPEMGWGITLGGDIMTLKNLSVLPFAVSIFFHSHFLAKEIQFWINTTSPYPVLNHTHMSPCIMLLRFDLTNQICYTSKRSSIGVLIAELCQLLKNNWIPYLKWINSTLCKLYFNKAVKKGSLNINSRKSVFPFLHLCRSSADTIWRYIKLPFDYHSFSY